MRSYCEVIAELHRLDPKPFQGKAGTHIAYTATFEQKINKINQAQGARPSTILSLSLFPPQGIRLGGQTEAPGASAGLRLSGCLYIYIRKSRGQISLRLKSAEPGRLQSWRTSQLIDAPTLGRPRNRSPFLR